MELLLPPFAVSEGKLEKAVETETYVAALGVQNTRDPDTVNGGAHFDKRFRKKKNHASQK
jgi:hypothetical protein